MIKDFLISFTDNFKEKTKNPFLGTYLLVWIIRNWDLIYTLFNFDKDCTLGDKKAFITNYYNDNDFIINFFTNILWTFGLLILTYALLNLSRVIVNLSEKQLTPWIYKITDSKSIVLKTEYDRIRTENDDLQYRLDKERESKSRLETRIKNLELEIIDITTPKQDVQITSAEVESSNSAFDDLAMKVYRKLQSQNLVDKFNFIVVEINKGRTFSNNNQTETDIMIELGLIKFEKLNYTERESYYQVTTLGEAVLNLIRLE